MDIANIFKSKTRKELFRLYFTNPEKEYYLRELERILDIPVSMIRKELQRLEKDGIFYSRKVGNLIFFHLNKDYPLLSELKSIVFKTIGVRGALEKALKGVRGVEVAFIYGSFAKNEENALSDIDLFIIGRASEDALLPKFKKLEKLFKREINYSLYSKDDFLRKKKAKDSFIIDLIRNPKIFLIGEANGL